MSTGSRRMAALSIILTFDETCDETCDEEIGAKVG